MRTASFLLLLGAASAFYLPGVAPRDYASGEPVELKVLKLDSVATQLPYDYYSLPFCQPAEIVEASENLGEVLSGERIETSPYELTMMKMEACKVLCTKTYDKKELEAFESKIKEKYNVNWVVDNIPAARKFTILQEGAENPPASDDDESTLFQKGYPLGFIQGQRAFLNNHIRMSIRYHEDQASFQGHRIVGFQVDPYSVKHEYDSADPSRLSTCHPLNPVTLNAPPQTVSGLDAAKVIFTYDVQWQKSPIKWASRWDLYLKMTDSHIHWFSIVNSMFMVLFLSFTVGMIILRTLRQDLARYNSLLDEDEEEETGWKLVHGDVFRTPVRAGLLSVLVGTGCQLIAAVLIMLLFACLGFLSPANRGGLMTALLLLFVCLGVVAGYNATRIYKMFGLTEWKQNTIHTALLFPGVIFSGFFVLNLFVWGEKSTGAVPFGTLVALMVLWLGISAPLVYVGSYIGFRREVAPYPVKINNIPRMIPADLPWYNGVIPSMVLGGLLPFATIFIEVFFILTSVWMHHFYYMFGVLALVFVLLIIVCAELSIVITYFQLCSEDYHWWWRSFLTSGASAFYLFAYSVHYYFTQLEIIKFVSGCLFFGYMFMGCIAFFIVTGTIGFLSTLFFVRKIYASVKVD